MKDVLLAAGAADPGQVTAVAEDEYRAVIQGDELDGGQVYLMIEGSESRLVVFGDPNSKRSVSRLVRLVVE